MSLKNGKLAGMNKVLVIGDSCTDVFIYGDIERICPEAPVPVFKPTNQTENGGMAKNVVRNLESLGCEVDLISNPNDIITLKNFGYDGFLIGENFMKTEDPGRALENFLNEIKNDC